MKHHVLKLLGTSLILPFISNCNFSNNEIENIINDKKLKEAVINFDLDYKLFEPGTELSFNYLWQAYDTYNKFGPKIDKDNRLITYLIDYQNIEDDFYSIYLRKSDISTLETWFSTFHQKNSTDVNNYHFVEDEKVIDGKYLLAAQQNNVTEFVVSKCNSLNEMPYETNNYQMVICLKKKKLSIEKNVSKGKIINKSLFAFHRVALRYDSNQKKLQDYIFVTPEKNNVSIVENQFNYIGKTLGVYPTQFENIDNLYFPRLGLLNYYLNLQKTIDVIVTQNKEVILPRFLVSGDKTIDLLDKNASIPIDSDDVFRNYKDMFLEAYIDKENEKQGNYIYGRYDLIKVLEIIENISY